MAEHLTGNTRTLTRTTALHVECTLVYEDYYRLTGTVWGPARTGTFDHFRCDYSETVRLKPWFNVTFHSRGSDGEQYAVIHYGAQSIGFLGAVHTIEIGSFEVPHDTGGWSTVDDPVRWQSFHWEVEGEYVQTWTLQQIESDTGSYMPSFTAKEVSTSGGTQTHTVIVGSDENAHTSAFSNQPFPTDNYDLDVSLSGFSNAKYAGPNPITGFSYPLLPNFTQGAVASAVGIYDDGSITGFSTYSYSCTAGTATQDTLTISAPGTKERHTGSLTSDREAKLTVEVEVEVTALGSALGENVTVQVGGVTLTDVVTSGSFTPSFDLGGQAAFTSSFFREPATGSSQTWNNSSSVPSNGWTALVKLNSASATAQVETEPEFVAYGQEWPGMSLEQEEEFTIEGDPWVTGTGGWAGTGGASVSVVSGALRIVTTTAGGGATINYPVSSDARQPSRVLGYRFLPVEVRTVGSANKPLRLTPTGVTVAALPIRFDLSTAGDGVWEARTLDVLQHSGSLPEAAVGTNHLLTGWTITNLAADTIYEIRFIKGMRQDESRATVLLGPLLPVGVGVVNPAAFAIDGLTDGWHSLRVQNFLTTTIKTAATYINTLRSGWNAVDLTPPGTKGSGYLPESDYLDGDRGLFTLHGGGRMSDDSMALDVPAETAHGFTAQGVYRSVTLHPGAGNVLTGGTFGDTANIKWRKMLRGQLAGVVISEDDQAPDVLITRTSDSADRGTTTPRTPGGAFASEAPFLQANVTHEAALDTDDDLPEVTFAGVVNRQRQYGFLHHDTGQYFPLAAFSERGLLHSGKDAKLRSHHLYNWALQGESSGYDVTRWVSLAADPRGALLAALGKSGTSLKVFLSTDGGMTATEVLTMTADSGALVATSAVGPLLLLYSTGGTIWRKMLPKGTTTWTAAEQVTDQAGTALTGKVASADYDPRHGGAIYLARKSALVYTVWESRDGGKSFIQVLA